MSDPVAVDAHRFADLLRRVERIESAREGDKHLFDRLLSRTSKLEVDLSEHGVKSLRRDLEDIGKVLEYMRTRFDKQFPPEQGYQQKK
jgi:hypothetical protein